MDMDTFSDDVHAGSPRKGVGVLVVLTLLLLVAAIVFLLKFLGVM